MGSRVLPRGGVQVGDDERAQSSPIQGPRSPVKKCHNRRRLPRTGDITVGLVRQLCLLPFVHAYARGLHDLATTEQANNEHFDMAKVMRITRTLQTPWSGFVSPGPTLRPQKSSAAPFFACLFFACHTP